MRTRPCIPNVGIKPEFEFQIWVSRQNEGLKLGLQMKVTFSNLKKGLKLGLQGRTHNVCFKPGLGFQLIFEIKVNLLN